MNEQRIIHAFDAGAPLSLTDVGLVSRFHGWRGISGRRYLTTVYPAAAAPNFAGAVVILARVEPDGTRVAMFVGRAPDVAAGLASLAAARGATEAHVHLIAETDAERRAVEGDLATAIGAFAGV